MQHTLRHWAARCALALAAALPLVCAAQGNSKGTITVAQAGPVGGPIGFYTHPFQGLLPAASVRIRAVETCDRAMEPST